MLPFHQLVLSCLIAAAPFESPGVAVPEPSPVTVTATTPAPAPAPA
ncbi:MAG: hypothetical protein RLZZ436_2776, partial [Planctomycetota bacterium]